MRMKNYCVCLQFQGSLEVLVTANSEEEAMRLGKEQIELMTAQDIADSAEFEKFEKYDIYETN
jgi:predicted RNase H-like HicB family nuclease